MTLFGAVGRAPCKWCACPHAAAAAAAADPTNTSRVARVPRHAMACDAFLMHAEQFAKAFLAVRIEALRFTNVCMCIERYILEIDPETHRAIPFAMVASGWGKWAGGVLATNGKIYGIPALSTSILEFD
eukprot:4969425-Pleurochrysis_carterae.AAC.1